jgi:RimJ/RimL family protein N-acetyltransferase
MPAPYLRLTGPRLDLVAATPELFEAELAGRQAFERLLGVTVPASWPPDFYDRDAIEQSLQALRADEAAAGWWMWYLLRRGESGEPPLLVGLCGYKGRPSPEGTVEIGYSVLAEHRRQGYASEAVELLLARAFAEPEVRAVLAETYPELIPSIGVLDKAGFRLSGPGSEERVIRFELPRESYVERHVELGRMDGQLREGPGERSE